MYLSITTKLRLNSINIFSEGTFYVPSEVKANSVREALGKVQDIFDEMSCKDCGILAECVDDSAQIDYDGIILDENQNIVEAE